MQNKQIKKRVRKLWKLFKCFLVVVLPLSKSKTPQNVKVELQGQKLDLVKHREQKCILPQNFSKGTRSREGGEREKGHYVPNKNPITSPTAVYRISI
jgi:hypothetical protein